jgi:Zn ribbon nucleic-acid-binding protein
MYTIAPEFTAWIEECEKIIAKFPHQLQRIAEGVELPVCPFSFRHGGHPQGTVFVEGRRYFTVNAYHCKRCGGQGGSEVWRRTGVTCYECNGSGHRDRTREETVYTAEALAKLNAKVDAKEAAKVAAEKAKEAAFEATYTEVLAAVAKLSTVPEFVSDVIAKGRKYGTLSDAQVAAVLKTVDRELAKTQTGWVGTIGERVTLDLTAIFVTSFDSRFGTCHVHGFKDAAGNVLIHKGAHIYVEVDDNRPNLLAKGDKVRIAFNIKEHGTREGVKQTIVTHPSRAEAIYEGA